MAWDDIEDDKPALPVVVADPPGDPIERVRAFDKAYSQLKDDQKTFLVEWKKNNFNVRRTLRMMGESAPAATTIWRWNATEHYGFVAKVMKQDIVKDILERERLVLRQDDCVEQLLEPKPILYQGCPTGFYENQPAAAAKVNETLLRVGGHMKEDEQQSYKGGPALVIQLTNRIGGEIISEVRVGVIPELPAPTPSWLDEE
jgi:hypothetical protein